MDAALKALLRDDVAVFAERLKAYEAGEVDKKAFKGFSGGFGSYAQRNGGYMLRLRMTAGRLTKERLAFLAQSVEKYGINRMKLTTCETVQLHDLDGKAVVELMEKALEVGIATRGGGGDFPRNVMASPLSGVQKDEVFDVIPYAEGAADYLLPMIRGIKLPRKLKIAFSNDSGNMTHATLRDLGFVAREDGSFDVYCAGGLGPNPKLGVKVAEAIPPEEVPACIDAMISVFTAFGDYENRAKSRTRYLQDTLGAAKLREEYQKALDEKRLTSPGLAADAAAVDKSGDGEISAERVIAQKQQGLYAVSYHPAGGNLPCDMPEKLYGVIRDMDAVECRISPDGTLYIINLTASEAKKVLEATECGVVTPFEQSVCCIGAAVCQQGVRDSQALLEAMIAAVREAELPADCLPSVHISGCPSSCGTHQMGKIGFQGGVKFIEGKPQPAFTLLLAGCERRGAEKLGEVLGPILEEEIPEFIVRLGRTVAASGLGFDKWLSENEKEFRELAGKYTV